MDPGVAAIIGAGVGVLGGGGAQLLERWLTTRAARRESKLALLEAALNSVTRQRRLVREWWSFTAKGATAAEIAAKRLTINDLIEEGWVHENALRIRFGEGGKPVTAYNELTQSVDAVMTFLRQGHAAPTTIEVQNRFAELWNTTTAKQRAFVEIIRDEVGSV